MHIFDKIKTTNIQSNSFGYHASLIQSCVKEQLYDNLSTDSVHQDS